MSNFDSASIYVSTYKKYNNGSLEGDWIDLNDHLDADEFLDACNHLHKDEDDPEFMFQDFVCIPERLSQESMNERSIQRIYDYFEELDSLDEDEQEAFEVFIEHVKPDLTKISSVVSDFKDKYQGTANSESEFSDEYFDAHHLPSMDNFISQFIDYDAFRRHLFSSGYNLYDGYVFLD